MTERPRTIILRIEIVLLAILLGAGIADRASKLVSKIYVSTVTMQLQGLAGNGLDPAIPKPTLDAVQAAILSDEVIGPVMARKELALSVDGDKTQIARRLRGQITVKGVRHTDLVQISVVAGDSQGAARLANAIAEEYQRIRLAEQQDMMSRALAQLQNDMEGQRRKVAAFKEGAEAIRLEAGVTDLFPDQVEEPKALGEAVADVKAKVEALRTMQKQLSEKTDKQLLQPGNIPDILGPTFAKAHADYQAVLAEEARLAKSGLGPDHPTWKEVRARRMVLEKQLGELLPLLRKLVDGKLKTEEDKLKMIESIMTAPPPDPKLLERYREAKASYVLERKVLEEMEMRFSTATMERSMPRNPAVIWEKAVPAPQAKSPRLAVFLVLGTLLGLMGGLALTLLPWPLVTALVLLGLTVLAWWPRMNGFLRNAEISTQQKKAVPRISIGGDVKSPMLLDFANDLTILRAINAAGGFTEYSDQKKVRLLRDGKLIIVNVTAIPNDPSKDIRLQPGDSIDVPQSIW